MQELIRAESVMLIQASRFDVCAEIVKELLRDLPTAEIIQFRAIDMGSDRG